MDSRDNPDQRLTDLEIKISYQEDLLDQLNQVVVRHQQEIELLLREVRQLRQQMPDAGTQPNSAASDEVPPHY